MKPITATIIADAGRGFFFAKRPGHAVDIFVHVSDIPFPDRSRLRVGATITCETIRADKIGRERATKVRIVGT